VKRGPTEHGRYFDLMAKLTETPSEKLFEELGIDGEQLDRVAEAIAISTLHMIESTPQLDDDDITEMIANAVHAAFCLGWVAKEGAP